MEVITDMKLMDQHIDTDSVNQIFLQVRGAENLLNRDQFQSALQLISERKQIIESDLLAKNDKKELVVEESEVASAKMKSYEQKDEKDFLPEINKTKKFEVLYESDPFEPAKVKELGPGEHAVTIEIPEQDDLILKKMEQRKKKQTDSEEIKNDSEKDDKIEEKKEIAMVED